MNVLICDDNKDVIMKVKNELQKLQFIKSIMTCLNGKDAIDIAKNNSIDLIITDIDMPKIDGLKAVKIIIEKYNKNIHTIFMTNYPEYSIKSHEFRPIDFITKPIDTKRLLESIFIAYDIHMSNKLISEKIVQESIFTYKFRKNINMVNFDNILFFEKNGRGINIILSDDTIISFYENFDLLHNRLPNYFFKSSSKYIVNLNKIYRVSPSGKNSLDIFLLNSNKKASLSKNLESDFLYRYHKTKF